MGADIAIMSGGPITLRNGWARLPFVGMRSHFWREDTTTMLPEIRDGARVRWYVSLCGQVGVVDGRVPALNEGNWPRCKRCQKREADDHGR